MINILMQHANIVTRMDSNKINRNCIRKHSIKDIIRCCDRIERNGIISDEYKNDIYLQEELITDEKFIKYLNMAYRKEYNMNKFKELLKQIKEHNEKMSDYPLKSIFCILDNKKLWDSAYYSFLKYFSNESFNVRKNATKNLNHFYSQNKISFEDLEEKERNLLKLNFLDNFNLIPNHTIKEVYKFLVDNENLRNIIDFFNSRKLYIPLQIEHYKRINENAKEIEYYMKHIDNKVQNDVIMYRMLSNWTKNDCNVYDLKVIQNKIENIEITKLESIFSNKTSYINFIYESKLKKFSLDNISGNKEDIVIYAIKENKKTFLKLIENNIDTFLSIPSNSILFYEKFYKKYVNLNEITLKHLDKLKTMDYGMYSNIDNLKEQNYTFNEIELLCRMENQYIKMYNMMLDLKIDERILRIRQLAKKDLLHFILDDEDIQKIAEKIKIKPLYSWIENDFKKIENISMDDAIQTLIHYDSIRKFIPEIKNRIELSYILRNYEKVMKYCNLEKIKENIESIDEYWIKLKRNMEFNDKFLNEYSNNIKEFLLNDGGELAYKYYNNRNREQKEAFKLIVKAQLMGKFKNLKYHTDDLKQEINFRLEDYQIEVWTKENANIVEGKYHIGEYDDFYHTMILGEYPQKTCLSYKDGIYNRCLLACFDSNKKILYAKINGKIVARAMIRLTKGSYNDMEDYTKMLSFIDVEKGTTVQKEKYKENLTLFLERPYISGISNSEERKVKKLFIRLLKEKAQKMNAVLVLSNYYNDEIDEQFISSRYYMYISKSKSSSQYLDSLQGEATISDEGQYKQNIFLISKIKEKEKSIFDERIFEK